MRMVTKGTWCAEEENTERTTSLKHIMARASNGLVAKNEAETMATFEPLKKLH
jgi:hypothetical protein